MRILSFTTLFPSKARPVHGVFVENRLQHLAKDKGVDLKVVAPVPFFPLASSAFGRYGTLARTPHSDIRKGIEVLYPRYLTIPKVGMSAAPALLYLGTRKTVRKIIDQGYDFDVLDAHYFYPDGVAAALLAREFGKPFTITARGTDLNLIPGFSLPRRQIRWASRRADHLITVCQALKDVLLELGTPDEKVTVLRNGVDLDLFRPEDSAAKRKELALTRFTLLSVGHLVERKGHHLIIQALKDIDDAQLVIAGDGEMRRDLESLALNMGVSDRITFLGAVPHNELHRIYAAADLLVLASDREGWPNVLLEAMACGTPVIATDVWGAGEIVRTPEAGRLVKERSPAALVEAISLMRQHMPEQSKTRAFAELHDWRETSDGQAAIFEALTRRG